MKDRAGRERDSAISSCSPFSSNHFRVRGRDFTLLPSVLFFYNCSFLMRAFLVSRSTTALPPLTHFVRMRFVKDEQVQNVCKSV